MHQLKLCGWALVGMAAAFAQTPSTPLTAREIFYAPAPAAKAEAAPAKAAAPAKQVSKAKTPVKTDDSVAAASTTTSNTGNSNTAASNAMPATAPKQAPVQVMLASATRKPLGIRLSILKVGEGGKTTEMEPDTTFKPGDRVRLNIEVSDSGYLYIINRGSSGTWTQLFPSPEMPNASNAVVPGAKYSVPPDRNFVVSDPPGSEKLFIILSRKPQLDIDSLTLDMSRRENSDNKDQVTPILSLPAPKEGLKTTMAHNLPPMNDAMVDRMRNAYSRDLIIEKVDEQTPGTRKETAVYAINPEAGDDSRVVLDAQIKHQ